MPKPVWIDTHAHAAASGPDGAPRPRMAEHLVDVLDQCDADLRFVMSCDLPWPERMAQGAQAIHDGNRFVHDLCLRAPGRLFGGCTVNPHFLDASLAVMETCFEQWGFVQLGEMLQYIMDYSMDSDPVERLVRQAIEYDVPVQVHVSTSNSRAGPSSFGTEQLRDLFGLVYRVPEAKYVLAHLVGAPKDDPPVVTEYLDMIDGEFGAFPETFWVELRDFNSPGVRAALERVPVGRLLAGTDWTTRVGPPFLPYGTLFGVTRPEDNPYPPTVAALIGFLRQAGATDDAIRRIASENATELYALKR